MCVSDFCERKWWNGRDYKVLKKRSILFRTLFYFWSVLGILITAGVIGFIIFYILYRGYSTISPDFLTEAPKGLVLGEEGGIAPAITGSLWFSGTAVLFGGIPAVATAMYQVFFAKNEKTVQLIRMVIQCISGIPSIVMGLFSYSFLVRTLGFGRCILSGGIALAIMILPFIEVKAEKIFLEVPKEMLEASYAMGCSKAYTFRRIVLPYSLGELISALVLGGCFAMGATPPVLFTGAVAFAGHPKSLMEPAMALPLHLYLLLAQGTTSLKLAYGTAFIMIAVLLICSLLAALYSEYRRRKWRIR